MQMQKRDKEYTDADIERVWSTTIAFSQLGKMLTSILNANLPVRDSGDSFVIRVPSQIMADSIQGVLPKLQKNIRDALGNDNVSFAVEVCEMELPKNLWTDDRVLDEIVSEHPGVRHLIEKFKLRRT